MKFIIDPYRGGNDTGKNINGQYEKNILLNISNYMKDSFSKKGIETELIRTNDVSLTDDERNSIINEIKNNNDIIIQNRISEDGEFNIIYPLRNSDKLASLISNNLEAQDITVDNYYQRRLPTATMLDYYSVIRNTNPNETIIIEYLDATDYEKAIDIIVDSIASYINPTNIYTVKKGDTLYSIANKYNVTVDEIKKLNNLSTNNLSIGMKLSIPIKEESKEVEKATLYTVVKGDTLYSIANKYNVTVDEIKKLNNLSSNNLSIGMKLNIPTKEESEYITTYTVVKGDTIFMGNNEY